MIPQRLNQYKNATDAFISLTSLLNDQGNFVKSRAGVTKEISSISFSIKEPLQRVLIVPYRFNNIFATIAETLWVFSGNNNLQFLSKYLPRAYNYSDDGITWRAGYGPRLRKWHDKVDQIFEVYKLLLTDRNSRRAVISLFDPSLDYSDSKDIPCNNWINCFLRNDKLSMNIAVRSNDLFWGFSGIDFFEWSFLFEILAFWLKAKSEKMTYLIGSLHFYERHFETSKKIITNMNFRSAYDLGFSCPSFSTNFEGFDAEIKKVLELERLLEREKTKSISDFNGEILDPLLRTFIQMLFLYNQFLSDEPKLKIANQLELIPQSTLRLAAIEYFSRKYKSFDWVSLSYDEKEFFSQFNYF